MNNNNHFTKLQKYGVVGICLALIGFMWFMVGQHQETVRQFNATISNHMNESTAVMRDLVGVTKETRKAIEKLTDWLLFENGKR